MKTSTQPVYQLKDRSNPKAGRVQIGVARYDYPETYAEAKNLLGDKGLRMIQRGLRDRATAKVRRFCGTHQH